MLESKVLISDGVRLIFGPEGERLYGKKNFMALYSVFTAPASMRVLHGGNHIGFLVLNFFPVENDLAFLAIDRPRYGF